MTKLRERNRTVLLVRPLHNFLGELQLPYKDGMRFGMCLQTRHFEICINQAIKAGPLSPFDLKMGTNLLIRNMQHIISQQNIKP